MFGFFKLRFKMKNEDIYWRKAKLAAVILRRQKRGTLGARDRRLAALFAQDEGVSDRLIHQAMISQSARSNVSS